MTKVFIVTSGEYSDYRINHVFSSEELAKKWIGENMDYTIEEYELDPPLDMSKNIMTSTGIDMSFEGGVFNVRGHTDQWGAFDKKARVAIQPAVRGSYVGKTNYAVYLEVVLLTRDLTQAIQTANEIRSRLLALQRLSPGIYNYETLELETKIK